MKNDELTSFNQILNSIDIKILEHGHLKAGNDWKFYDLASPFNRLYFVIGGKATIKDGNDHEVLMKPGYVYFTPLYESFDYVCEDYFEKFYIHFRMEIIPGHDVFKDQKECIEISACAEDINSLLKIGKENNNSNNNSSSFYANKSVQQEPKESTSLLPFFDLGSLVICKGMLLKYIGELISRMHVDINEQISFSGKYYRAYDYIQNNCTASLRVQDIADYLNISISNLSKSFKNDTGLTLKRYIEDKIVSRAQEMLLVTNSTVKDVATQLEFSDEYHFSRFFKNRTGISPSKYRLRSNTYK